MNSFSINFAMQDWTRSVLFSPMTQGPWGLYHPKETFVYV